MATTFTLAHALLRAYDAIDEAEHPWGAPEWAFNATADVAHTIALTIVGATREADSVRAFLACFLACFNWR